MEDSIKSCLDELLENNYLSQEDYKQLKPVGSRPGVLYGLCKVHKDRTNGLEVPPFRPIPSAIRTCAYNLAKFFVSILKEFTINEYTVKDSFSFADEIAEQDGSLYMVSFDVESLSQIFPWTRLLKFAQIEFSKRRKR